MLSDQDVDPSVSEAKWTKPKHDHGPKARSHSHDKQTDSATKAKPGGGYRAKYNAHEKQTDSATKAESGGGYLAMYRKKQHR